MRTRTLLAISAIIALLGGVVSYFLVANAVAETTSEKPKTPVSLVGKWVQTNGTGDILAEATISDVGSVQIDLKTRDSSSIYWMGSFDTTKDASKPFTVVSLADPDAQKAMAKSLFGSQDKTKELAYENGELSYEFTMMGTTSTVRLTRQ
jgi:hypothetical protein